MISSFFQRTQNFSEMLHAFSHEVGHNMGAKHDENTKKCQKDSNFLMSAYGGTQMTFSHCSIRAIHKVLDKIREKKNCLENIAPDFHEDNFWRYINHLITISFF